MKSGQVCDGVSMVPALRGQKPLRDAVFCYFPHAPKVPDWLPPSAGVRKGDWKLIRIFFDGENGRHRYELYNLREDIGERRNLAAQFPGKVRELDALIEDFLTRTRAVLPKPNPDYDPNATDQFGGWKTVGNRQIRIHFDRRWKTMLCRVFGPDPVLATAETLALPPGRYRFQVSMLSLAAGSAAHDGNWHDYSVDIRADQGIAGLRFVPCTEQGTVRIRRIRLLRPDGSTAKEWSFEKAPPRARRKQQPPVGGWRPGPNGHAKCSLRDGVLHLEVHKDDPMIMTAQPLNAERGEYVLTLRMKARAKGDGQVLVRPATRSYLPGTGTPFAVHHDGQWHEYKIRLRIKHRLHEIRIDPCAGPGEIDVDWIRLERADGRLVRQWTFDGR